MIIIESHKIIDMDKKTISIYSIIDRVIVEYKENEIEINNDKQKIINISKKIFLTRYRHNKKAHFSLNDKLPPFYLNIWEINILLNKVEKLVYKYKKWMK